MIGNETDKVTEELFWPLLHRYPMGLEGSMMACKLVFDHVDGLCWKFESVIGWFYIVADHTNSFYWLDQKQKGTMNPSNDDDNCNKP